VKELKFNKDSTNLIKKEVNCVGIELERQEFDERHVICH
jgi:hypothetical protein